MKLHLSIMKKNKDIKRILNVFLLLCLPLALQAAEISQQQAKEKALAFMLQRQGQTQGAKGLNGGQIQDVEPVEMGLQSLYAFNCEGGGYVIVSGDDRTTPILAYSTGGSLDVAEMPSNLRTWIDGYDDQISRLRQGYAKLLAKRAAQDRPTIEPLIKTRWNQRDPYNWECPKDMKAGGVLSASGCVATAMSQVMYYHKWPQEATLPYTTPGKKDVPSTTFEWDKMLPIYEEGQYTEAQGNAVAHLMRWAGWSVDMEYAASMSGSATGRIEKALRQCFGYDKNVHWVNYGEYSLDAWEELIYNELANGRPVIYNGYNSNHEGHSFICDGYEDGKFHFNWGWGGKADGYFEIRVLEPSFSGVGGSEVNLSWSDLNEATIGIQKPTDDAAIDYAPCTETNEGFYVYGPKELTRGSTSEAFPRIRTHFYVSGAASNHINEEAYRYALLKDGRIHCMLWGGKNKVEPNPNDLISIAYFSVILPDTLSDGEYQMVPMHETGQEPSIRDVVTGSQRNYIGVKVEGTKLTLKNYPEVRLEVSNPRKEYHEDDSSVKSVTFSVKNTSMKDYVGYLNLYMPETQRIWNYERVRLYPNETRDIKVLSKGKSSNAYAKLAADADFCVYADRSFVNCLYGQKINDRRYSFGNFTVSGKYVDSENRIIRGSKLNATVSVTNQTDADYKNLMEILVLNADSLCKEMIFKNGSVEIEAGKTYSVKAEKNIDADWKKVVFCFRYRNDGHILEEIYSDVYTVIPVISTYMKDGTEVRYDDCEVFVTPEDASFVMVQNTSVKQVKPNANPNTVYYADMPQPAGLDNCLVVDGSGTAKSTLFFNTDSEAFYTQGIMPHIRTYVGLQHTFKADETNCWLSLAFPYDNFFGDVVTDVATGEDVSQKIKCYSPCDNEENYGLSKGELHVKSVDSREGFCLLRVDPSLAGRTVRFSEGTFNNILVQVGGLPNMTVFNNYRRQSKENVYVLEGDRFVLKQSCEVPPFKQYMQPDAGAENLPASLTIVDVDNTTGIDEVKSRETDDAEVYYDLQGRRLQGKPQRGLYIKKGGKTTVQ